MEEKWPNGSIGEELKLYIELKIKKEEKEKVRKESHCVSNPFYANGRKEMLLLRAFQCSS